MTVYIHCICNRATHGGGHDFAYQKHCLLEEIYC